MPTIEIMKDEKRILTLVKINVTHDNKQHKLEEGSVIEILAEKDGTPEVVKSTVGDTKLIRYFKNYRFVTLPITYIL